jgi:ribose 5-phosphate isomerase RpiB
MSDSPAKPRIALGFDHAGFPIKETIRKYLEAAVMPSMTRVPRRKNPWTIPITEEP